MHFDRRKTARYGRPGKSSLHHHQSSASFLTLHALRTGSKIVFVTPKLLRSLYVANRPRRNVKLVNWDSSTRMRCTTILEVDLAMEVLVDECPIQIPEQRREDSLRDCRRQPVIVIRPTTSPVQLVSGYLCDSYNNRILPDPNWMNLLKWPCFVAEQIYWANNDEYGDSLFNH